MIDTEILQDYSSEARELLEEMDSSLMRVEKEGGSPDLLNNIFRAVHCIKGSAEYIGLERSSTLTHGVENLLDRVRGGAIRLDARIIDFLFRAKDLILTLIMEVADVHEEKTPISGIMEELDSFLEGSPVASPDISPLADGAFIGDHVQTSKTEAQGETVLEMGVSAEPAEMVEQPNAVEQETSSSGAEMRSGDESLYEDSPTVMDYSGTDEAEKKAVDNDISALAAEEELSSAEETALTENDGEPGVIIAEASVEVSESEAAPRSDSGASLEGTIPHILNVSLYLDDLEDGLQPAEVMVSILDTLRHLTESMRAMDFPEAAAILRSMEAHLSAIPEEQERLSSEEIENLRAFLHDLRPWYPEGLFPLEQGASRALGEVPAVEPSSEAPLEPSAFRQALEHIPGLEAPVITALEEAGFSSVEQLARADLHTLTSIPALTPSTAEFILKTVGDAPAPARPPSRSRKPGGRSMLADVDDELLREFEGIFGEGKILPEPYAPGSNPSQSSIASDLLEELDTVREDADREIIEIFLSYAWEITDKLRRLGDKINQGAADREDMEACADLIKSIRSSSSYMDYQKLAAFLDEWHEKVLWCADRMDSLSSVNLAFMEESMTKFEHFLNGLEAALNSDVVPAFNGVAPVDVRQPVQRQVDQQESYAASGEGFPGPSAADQGFIDVRRPTEIMSGAPVGHVTQETTSVQPDGIGQEATTEEILRAVKSAPSMPAPVAGKTPSADDETTTSEITRSHDTKFFQELATARDARESSMVRTMRVDSTKVDVLLNQVGELVVNRSYVEQLSLELRNLHRTLLSTREVTKKEIQSVKDLGLKVGEASLSLGRVANDIQEGVMKLRMLPVGQLFNRMPRLIRDLSRRVGKSVGLEVHGGDTEVDKRVIEQIYNPLVHLIRNAVDHGIEEREDRKRVGKTEEGTIVLNAYSEGNQVVIDVEDDGAGINHEAVIRKAIENRLLEAQEAKNVPPQEIYNYLFLPGFSTSRKVTRTSGRGVGMDVVKKDVEKINGHIEIESWENQGTRISIKIPLTLAIIQTLLIRMGQHTFAVPLTSVREIIQVAPTDISTIEGFEVIKFRDETIPVLRMNEVFNLKDYDSSKHPKFLVLATSGLKTVGFLVEELVGEQDVVIKPLADHVCESRGMAGSTILGDGTIALVLDVTEVIEDAIASQRQLGATGIRFGQQTYRTSLVSSLDV
ncbi:MAG: chemotaxis protein CheW [Desulfomonilaceae bacterium]